MLPGLSDISLISTGKLVDLGYVSIFDKDEVNIYDMNNTEITVSWSAILKGWRSEHMYLWRIPLNKGTDKEIADRNTETVLVNRPLTHFLMDHPPPIEAIFNVYELKKQPEVVRYHHAAAGFPSKLTWLKAINNGHYVPWSGLTSAIVQPRKRGQQFILTNVRSKLNPKRIDQRLIEDWLENNSFIDSAVWGTWSLLRSRPNLEKQNGFV